MENKEITGNRFVDQLDFYQAANSSNEAIKRNFVIRLSEFQLIIEGLKAKRPKDSLQHELILGRRGSGKSTLLKRIQIEIEEDPDLSKKYIAINTAEEQAAIFRLFDLWLEVLRELQIKLAITLSLKDYDEFETDQDYTRYLYNEIHALLKASKKKAVLLLDNLDRVLGNFSDDGHLLRETLHNFNDIQIIGGSTRMDEHFWKYDKPFYEFFRRHRLEGLSSEEIHRLLNHWSNIMNMPELAEFTKNNFGKIEALRILTDGLPRTLQFFIQILLQNSDLYGFDYIRRVMSDVTPLYQERLNYLPPAQRKIVLEMAFLWEACSAKQLAEKCNMESKLISAHLKQLSDNGIVEILSTSKKNHLYRLSERFFNMWLIVTQGNPDQKRKTKWLTIFLETWYDAKQLKAMALQHLQGLKENALPYDRAMILTKALTQSRYTSTIQRDEMLNHTITLFPLITPLRLLELPKKYSDIKNETLELLKQNKFDQAQKLVDEIENEEDGNKFLLKAYLYYLENKLKDAEKFYLKSAKKGNAGALNNLAFIYSTSNRIKEAEKCLVLADKAGSKHAKLNLGLLKLAQRKSDEAEKFFFDELKNGNVEAGFFLASIYYTEKIKKEDALKLIKQRNEKTSTARSRQMEIIIEIWNGHFNNLEERIRHTIEPTIDMSEFIQDLLIHEQYQLVFNLFNDNIYGNLLQERYSLLYYAFLLSSNYKSIENIQLRIPPEVLPTILEIIINIKSEHASYYP